MTPETGLLDWPHRQLRMLATTSTERDVRLHSCKKEIETTAWLESLPVDAVLYDVGANVGAYTLIGAALGLEVVAFEPAPANVAHLAVNLRLNNLTATVLPIALTDRPQIVLLSAEDEAGWTHTISTSGWQAVGFPLDYLVSQLHLPVPTAVKIDVDGHETHVIEGATWTLARTQTVLVEVQGPWDTQVAERLQAAGLQHRESYPHLSGVTNQIWSR